MNLAAQRQKRQTGFLLSGTELEVGNRNDCPVDIDQLKNICSDSDEVIQTFNSGLTSIVYKIGYGGHYYSLKKKRDKILVQNVDGQASFLNEVQRRKDFYEYKRQEPEVFKTISETIYASLSHGIIISHWIEGEEILSYNEGHFSSIFRTLFEIEKKGLFECDLTSSNLLADKNWDVYFFDFGYMYPFDPLIHYNSDGREKPVFHMAERFESRSLMQFLIDQEKKGEAVLDIFEMEKREAFKIYTEKLAWLKTKKAHPDVVSWQKAIVQKWETGLASKSNLKDLLDLEMFRSLIMDIDDDISGKSCTIKTLAKAEKLLGIILENYAFIKHNQGLMGNDRNLTKIQLVDNYKRMKEEIIRYMLE